MTPSEPTMILFRPVGKAERDLIAESGFRAFPPRLRAQPIFYPVLNESYATQIAWDWNTKGCEFRIRRLRDAVSGAIGVPGSV